MHPDKDMTDWERVRNMTDEEAYANALSDPDAQPMTEEELARMIPVFPKQAISIRLDSDIISWFQQFGPRYQTRINAVLKAYVQRHKSTVTGHPKKSRASAKR